jgi:hypothetical protein
MAAVPMAEAGDRSGIRDRPATGPRPARDRPGSRRRDEVRRQAAAL